MERNISSDWDDYQTVPAREYSFNSRNPFEAASDESSRFYNQSSLYQFPPYMQSPSSSVLDYQSNALSENFLDGMCISDDDCDVDPVNRSDDECSTELASLVNLVSFIFIMAGSDVNYVRIKKGYLS